LGLDVHAATIAVAVAESMGEVRSLGTIPNRPESVRKLIRKLGKPGDLRACYEAGPCGYVLYWQLRELGVDCQVIAPTLVPTKAGDRVKTDRRDAQKLAQSFRAGDLTPVWVPDTAHEALRDLVRARLAAKHDQTRHRNQLGKFLLRHGRRPPAGMKKAWTQRHREWVRRQVFEQPAQQAVLEDHLWEVERVGERIARLERSLEEAIEKAAPEIREMVAALQALRGIAKLTAVTIVAEVGRLSRFDRPDQLMGYTGIVSREHSSGDRVRRGAITKTGNAHLRRVICEASWAYRHKPSVQGNLRKRQEGLPKEVIDIAWKAQKRLHGRYVGLMPRKGAPKTITAVARELVGFVWAIGVEVERRQAA
jgi:transposase